MRVWVVVEEAEVGSLAGGSPYEIHSAHTTEEGAVEAAKELREGYRNEYMHETGTPWLDEEAGRDDEWVNGNGAFVHEMEVEE